MNQPIVAPSELVARFLLYSNCYASLAKRVKYPAFLPARDMNTSVFRVSTLSENEIWKIGKDDVAKKREKKLHGRADIKAKDILEVGLAVEPETSSHPLHANIVNWPLEKQKQNLFAMKLAERAKLCLVPTN